MAVAAQVAVDFKRANQKKANKKANKEKRHENNTLTLKIVVAFIVVNILTEMAITRNHAVGQVPG